MTHQQKVLAMMIRGPKNLWWHAYDFIGEVAGLFVGHRAPARISDIARRYPDLVETMKDPDKPRLHMYRWRHENYAEFIKNINAELKQTALQEMLKKGYIPGETFLSTDEDTVNPSVDL